MGALAPLVPSWSSEDDLLLKNAVEAGASLESLAKGAVQFSRKFSVQELEKRWFSILYDPVVSTEASIHMREIERSAAGLPSKAQKSKSSNNNKCTLGKRKAESVRRCYYAMRKRILNEPLNSVDLGFLVGPDFHDNREKGPASCMLGHHDSNGYSFDALHMGIANNDTSQSMIAGDAVGNYAGTSNTLHPGLLEGDMESITHNKNPDIYSGSYSGLEKLVRSEPDYLCEPLDLEAHPVSSFHYTNRDPERISSEFERNQGLTSPILNCDMSFPDVGYSSPLNGAPIWPTIGQVSSPSNTVDYKMDTNLLQNELIDTGSKPDIVPFNDLKSSHALPEGYFAELSNSLLTFSNEEELMFKEDDIHKSFFDGLSSLLSSPTQDEHISGMLQTGVSAAPESYLETSDSACPGESAEIGESSEIGGSCDSDEDMARELENQLLTSEASEIPQCPELDYGICTLNTQDTEIPCNDDFCPNQASPFLPASQRVSLEGQTPATSCFKVPKERSPTVIHTESKHTGVSHTFSQTKMWPKVRKMGLDSSRPNLGAPNSELSHVGSRNSGNVSGSGSQLTSLNSRKDAPAPGKVKAEYLEVPLVKPAGCDRSKHLTQMKSRSKQVEVNAQSAVQNKQQVAVQNSHQAVLKKQQGGLHVNQLPALQSNQQAVLQNNQQAALQNNQKEALQCNQHAVLPTNPKVALQNNQHPALQYNQKATGKKIQPLQTKLEAVDLPSPTLENPTTSEQEEYPSDSEEDIPYYSDVEAMILDMDLGPCDQDGDFSKKASRYQHEETQKTIVRLEQGAHSFMQRVMASHGALAVLCGRYSKHYIKKSEVLLGRATEDVNVDIDLGREGKANRISRRQAAIKLDNTGSFYLTNLGKFPVYVNNMEIFSGQNMILEPGSFVEMRGMPFVFEVNRTCVKQLSKITNRCHT